MNGNKSKLCFHVNASPASEQVSDYFSPFIRQLKPSCYHTILMWNSHERFHVSERGDKDGVSSTDNEQR